MGVLAPFWKVLNLSCSLLPLRPAPITPTLAAAHATDGKPPSLAVGSQRVSPCSPLPWQHCPVAQQDWSGPAGSETGCRQSMERWEEGEDQKAQVSGPLSGFHVSGRVLVSHLGFWACDLLCVVLWQELGCSFQSSSLSLPVPCFTPLLAAHYKMPASLQVQSGRSGSGSVPCAAHITLAAPAA